MAEETVDRCIESGDLKPKRGCVTKGLILNGGEKWTPTSYIRLVQDYGLDTEVNRKIEILFFYFHLIHKTGCYSSFEYIWRSS